MSKNIESENLFNFTSMIFVEEFHKFYIFKKMYVLKIKFRSKINLYYFMKKKNQRITVDNIRNYKNHR